MHVVGLACTVSDISLFVYFSKAPRLSEFVPPSDYLFRSEQNQSGLSSASASAASDRGALLSNRNVLSFIFECLRERLSSRVSVLEEQPKLHSSIRFRAGRRHRRGKCFLEFQGWFACSERLSRHSNATRSLRLRSLSFPPHVRSPRLNSAIAAWLSSDF